MGSTGDDCNFLALQSLGAHIVDGAVTERNKASRGSVVGIAEIDACSHLRRLRDRRNNCIAVVAVERADQRVKPAHLHGALNPDLFADHPREVDVETGRIAVGAGVIERWIVSFREEANDGDAGQVGPFGAAPRIPEARNSHRIGRHGRRVWHSRTDGQRRRTELPWRLRAGGRGREQQRNNGPCTAPAQTRTEFRHHPTALPRNRADHIIAVAVG